LAQGGGAGVKAKKMPLAKATPIRGHKRKKDRKQNWDKIKRAIE